MIEIKYKIIWGTSELTIYIKYRVVIKKVSWRKQFYSYFYFYFTVLLFYVTPTLLPSLNLEVSGGIGS